MNEKATEFSDRAPNQIELIKRGVVNFEDGTIWINSEDIVDKARELVDSAKPETDWNGNFAGTVTLTIEFLGDMKSKE